MPMSQKVIGAEEAHKLAIWAGRHKLLFARKIKVQDEQILVIFSQCVLYCKVCNL